MATIHLERLIRAGLINKGCSALSSQSLDNPVTSSVENWSGEKIKKTTTAGLCCRKDCPFNSSCKAYSYEGHVELVESL